MEKKGFFSKRKAEEAIDAEAVYGELLADEKLMKRAAKLVQRSERRKERREAWESKTLGEKVKVIAKPVIIGGTVVGAVATGLAVALSKNHDSQDVIEGTGTVEELEPWNCEATEGFESTSTEPTETVDVG